MIITFADGTTLEGKSVNLTDDSHFLIITLTSDYEKSKETFKNEGKISTITTDDSEFNGYTILKSIMSTYDGIEDSEEIRVELEYSGLSAEIDSLKTQLEDANSQVEMLTACILELSDIVYS